MICDGHGRHLQFSNSLGQRADFDGSVQQAVVSVQMQMYKLLVHICFKQIKAND